MDPATMALLIALGAAVLVAIISEYLGSNPDSKYKSILTFLLAVLSPIAKKAKPPEDKK